MNVSGSQRDDNWLLPVMYDVCLDLRLFAVSADKQKREAGKGKPGETLEKASEGIMACFRVCAADARAAEDVTKRWGMLNLVNQLFKIYFSQSWCKQGFTCKYDMEKHTRKPTGEKQYQCEICSKNLVQVGSLAVHVLGHTKEKPYSCSDCRKSFAGGGQLMVHQRITLLHAP